MNILFYSISLFFDREICSKAGKWKQEAKEKQNGYRLWIAGVQITKWQQLKTNTGNYWITLCVYKYYLLIIFNVYWEQDWLSHNKFSFILIFQQKGIRLIQTQWEFWLKPTRVFGSIETRVFGSNQQGYLAQFL